MFFLGILIAIQSNSPTQGKHFSRNGFQDIQRLSLTAGNNHSQEQVSGESETQFYSRWHALLETGLRIFVDSLTAVNTISYWRV